MSQQQGGLTTIGEVKQYWVSFGAAREKGSFDSATAQKLVSIWVAIRREVFKSTGKEIDDFSRLDETPASSEVVTELVRYLDEVQ